MYSSDETDEFENESEDAERGERTELGWRENEEIGNHSRSPAMLVKPVVSKWKR
jgi:hypothetical protein